VAVATVIMDRVIALWGLFWFVAVLGAGFWAAGMLEGPGEGPAKLIVKTAAIIVAVTLAVWVALGFLPPHRAEIFAGRLSRIPKVGGSAAEFWRAVWMYRLRPGSIALTLLLSWVGFVGFVLSFYCFARTLWDGSPDNPIPTVTQHFLIVPIGLVIEAAPLFPGGAGIGELGFGALYGWFGSKDKNGVLASLIKRVINWVIGLAGWVVLLRTRLDLLAAEQPAATVVSPAAARNGDDVWGAVQPQKAPAG
jgi:hypothetical protein